MSFDLLAPHYRWMELLLAGQKLQLCRTAFLHRVEHSQNVLLLGEGNGRFLLECRRALPLARIVCVDASLGMLRIARRKLENELPSPGETKFVHADALAWPLPSNTFDLIVTHFFLDCFLPEQLPDLIQRLAKAAKPGASWLIADFHIPRRGFLHYRAWLIHRLMYWFFRLATRLPAHALTSPDPFLEQFGFVLSERRFSEWNLLQTDRWQQVNANLL